MKKSMRTFLTICGIVIGVGLILGIAGLALGGIQGLPGVEARVPWISFGSGHGIEEQSVDVEPFESIDLESDMAEVQLIEGNKFAVEMSYDKEDSAPQVEVKNGTLFITPGPDRHTWVNFDLFGSREETRLKIYYPKGTNFTVVKIQNDMGTVTAADLTAKTIELSTDTGDMELDRITADYMDLDVDMGSIKGKQIKTRKGADADIDTGSLELSGRLAGTINVICDMGNCRLATNLPKNDYSLEVENDMGECTIDGQKLEGNYPNLKEGALNHFKLELDTGNAEIRFR